MRKILITNDDGIDADGIIRLARIATEFGQVWVVAPDGQRSAASHSITLRHPIEAWKVDFPVEGVEAFACNGTPGDCVRIGSLNIVPCGPDVVFSGINNGYNVASDIQYSATAGAAFEGAFQGFKSIAFSEDCGPNHEVTDTYIREILEEIIDKPLGVYQIWNVNFPACPLAECKGIKRDVTVSTDVFFKDKYNETKLPDGRISYMVEGMRKFEAAPNTDLRAVFDNYISVGIVNNVS